MEIKSNYGLLLLAIFYISLYITLFTWIKKKYGLFWALLFVVILWLPTTLTILTGRILGQDEFGKWHVAKWRK